MTTKSLATVLSLSLLIALPLATAAGDCGGQDKSTAAAKAMKAGYDKSADIVDTAIAAGSFKTLTAALDAAGLVDALRAEGPFTVFAPTDEAFAKLPAGTVESLLAPENRDKLVRILTYHVVKGKVTANDVMKIDSAEALSGDELSIAANKSGVHIDNAMVVQPDIEASNGVIHVIDTVLIPADES
jgi:uncharacterized surface protein with fasciclin (FAS1) repeats